MGRKSRAKRERRQREEEGDQGAGLGFAGRTMTGESMPAAWQAMVDKLAAPDGIALGILKRLAQTPEGRATLRQSRADWLAAGCAPPWEVLAGPLDQEPDAPAMGPEQQRGPEE